MISSILLKQSASFRISLLGIVSFILGSLWLYHGIGMLVSPLIILIIKKGINATQRFFLALIYFAVGSVGLLNAFANFFHVHHSLVAILCWLSSSLLLAWPWIFYRSFYHLLIILLLEAVPPLGLIGWLSPIDAMGFWFPGAGLSAIVLAIMSFWIMDKPDFKGIFLLLLTIMSLNIVYTPARVPPNWIGVDTQTPLTVSPTRQINYLKKLLHQIPRDKTMIILPESIINNWFTGTRLSIEQIMPHQMTLLIGVIAWHKHQPEDALAMIKHSHAQKIPLFYSVFPVPFAMWNPFITSSFPAHWWPATSLIEQVKVNTIICYDQLLVWPWLSFLITQPDLLIAVSNEWWADSSLIPDIQEKCRQSWSRLLNLPMIVARNRSLNN
ncbi:hypothetical protein [Ferrovum sp. JA12]|uniref:hypothetical protein n=1 Tax=Ferrovum sp. JA12 TaxID=1356299 RepID=UPI00128EC9E4|nr:hypothetical protein [Ferrovum sp. JA12]